MTKRIMTICERVRFLDKYYSAWVSAVDRDLSHGWQMKLWHRYDKLAKSRVPKRLV